MSRHLRILYSAGLIVSTVLVWLTLLSLFRDILPSERPIIVKVNGVIAVLAMLALATGFGHVLYTRRASIDQRFLAAFLVLAALRLLTGLVLR